MILVNIRWNHENKFDNLLWNIRWLDDEKSCVSWVYISKLLIRMMKWTTFMLWSSNINGFWSWIEYGSWVLRWGRENGFLILDSKYKCVKGVFARYLSKDIRYYIITLKHKVKGGSWLIFKGFKSNNMDFDLFRIVSGWFVV